MLHQKLLLTGARKSVAKYSRVLVSPWSDEVEVANLGSAGSHPALLQLPRLFWGKYVIGRVMVVGMQAGALLTTALWEVLR